jgi:SAM-dependent methyltransferase
MSPRPLGARWKRRLGTGRSLPERLTPIAERLVDRLGVHRGQLLLDLPCGTGTAALVAAQRGAHVIGSDVEPCLLRSAAERSKAAGLDIIWRQTDLSGSFAPVRAFDVVLSSFGITYVPDGRAAAREAVRACRREGRIGVTAWTSGSFMADLNEAVDPLLETAQPQRAHWGDETALRKLLIEQGARLWHTSRELLLVDFANVGEAVESLLTGSRTIALARSRFEREGRWSELRERVQQVVERRSEKFEDRLLIQLDYLLAVATARGEAVAADAAA